ncbi:peptide chain release factor N(5)-glutamine methyltransferase [Anaerophaga thermohalophila]|uniref:peptide chain release factor N(5)-glutamine methyltransferase n=1 Tax=Anaerophaga thermohalophila TaxID=177400 RepID=UPI0002D4CCCE|nr:peptide chain release factor N(5)-glutamine methyltransferase [Anaerophaga thermohalophila]
MQPTVKEFIQKIRQELSDVYPPHEAFQFAWLIFEHLFGWSKTELMLNDHTKLNDSEHLFVQKALEKLINHEPIQYILGKTEFFGLPVKVNPSVLVPRPETEELVEWIIQSVSPGKPVDILDIGTGSGCIAIALAKMLPKACVSAWDISQDALNTAAENAHINEVKIHLERKNVLNLSSSDIKPFDVIVSNPPYVRESEKELMQSNVLNYEPHVALFVSDSDPLLFFRAIAEYADTALNENGKLFFEINRDFGEPVRKLLAGYGFRNIELRKDLSGNCRMVKADKPVRSNHESSD